MNARRKGWSVDSSVRFKKLNRDERIKRTVAKGRRQLAQGRRRSAKGRHRPARFRDRYTVVRRQGKEVLHLLPDYYSDAVLQAAQDEDIQPFGTQGDRAAFVLFLSDLYVGEVSSGPDGNQRTVAAIERNVNISARRDFKKYAVSNAKKHIRRRATYYSPRLDTGRFITRSTQPVIPQEIADKGVAKAKRGRNR